MAAIEINGYQKRTALLAITSMGVMMFFSLLSSIYEWGWISITIIDFILALFFTVYAFVARDGLLKKISLFGIIAGILELWVDKWIVDSNTLVYPEGEPMLVVSPFYMPVAWMVVMIQMSYLSLMLMRWKGLAVATIAVTLIGGGYIPIYEHLAKGAGWWYYVDTPMVYNAPYYVIIAEAFLCTTVPWMARHLSQRGTGSAALMGVLEAAWMFASTFAGYQIVKWLF